MSHFFWKFPSAMEFFHARKKRSLTNKGREGGAGNRSVIERDYAFSLRQELDSNPVFSGKFYFGVFCTAVAQCVVKKCAADSLRSGLYENVNECGFYGLSGKQDLC